MSIFTFTIDSSDGMVWPETLECGFATDASKSGFAASGSLASGSGTADFVISEDIDEGSTFDNDTYPSDTWWSAEYGGRTNKDSSGFITDWLKMNDITDGTTQTVSYRKPYWEDNQTNGFPHIRAASGDYLEMDKDLSVRANQDWTIAIMTGAQAPSLYGCWLGSLSSTTTIGTAYRWQGRRLLFRNESGDELQYLYSSTDSSEYGGGARSLHVLRCDSSDVYMRWNGDDLTSHTPTAGAQYNFSRIFHYQTSSTQQNTSGSIHEIVYWPYFLSGSDLTDMEGMMMCKYDQTSKLPSSHPYYNATDTDYFKTSKNDSSVDFTTATLSLTTTQANFSTKSTSLSANTNYVVFPVDIGNFGSATIKMQYT